MLNQKLQDALNGQITAEMWSANLYMSMSFYFEKEGFSGFATWLKKQAAEETEHAYAFADYIIKRGGTALVGALDTVPTTWETPLAAFEHVYNHETTVSAAIDRLLDLAQELNDKATQDFLWQFVREQVEEEATASSIVDRIRRMGSTAIFNLDQQYGGRQ